MPSLSRRRELDLRSTPFESEAKMSDVRRFQANDGGTHIKDKLFTCTSCGKLYRERSRHCPRCDKHSMMRVLHIPESERTRLKARNIREARARIGL